MELKRLPNWRVNLVMYLSNVRNNKAVFDWEEHHCVTFAAGAVFAQTGIDFWAPHRDQVFEGPGDAYKYIRRLGAKTMNDLVARWLEQGDPAYTKFGDIVLVPPPAESMAEYNALGMPYALAVAEPPFYWALSEKGLSSHALPSVNDLIRYKV